MLVNNVAAVVVVVVVVGAVVVVAAVAIACRFIQIALISGTKDFAIIIRFFLRLLHFDCSSRSHKFYRRCIRRCLL